MSQIDMSDDTIFKGWYQYEEFPNGAASRWCSDNGTVTLICNDPTTRAIGVYISTVGKFNKCRFTVKSKSKVVGKLEIEPEVGTYYIPVNVPEHVPGKLTLNIKCWDDREFVDDPRILGLFIDNIWFEGPVTNATLKLLWDETKQYAISGDPRDIGIMPCIKASNYWETATQRIVDRFVGPDSICLDVGANIGAITIPMAAKAKKVFAFEVGSIPYGYLKTNLMQNNITNVEVIRGAVSDVTSKLFYHYTYPNVGGSYVNAEARENDTTIVEEIKGITLDSLIDQFEKVDFIKMDIEGFELRALEGAKELLTKFKPTLFIEFNPVAFRNMHGKSITPLWDFLAAEYEYIYVVRDDGIRRVKTYTEAVAGIDMTTRTLEDLLCTHEEVIE